HGVDDAIRADAANADVALVVDVEAAVRRHRQADDAPELRQPRRAAIAAIAYGSRAGNGGDDAVWGHLSHQGAALADIQAAAHAGAGHRADGRGHRAGTLPPPVAAVDQLVERDVGVLRAERPAAQADAPLVEGADEVAPRPKHGDLIARPRACDRVARVVAEAVRGAVFRRVGVADADRDRL